MACKILITGFGAFPGAPSNPSAALVRDVGLRHRARLARLGIDLRICVLSVEFASISTVLQAIFAEFLPDAVVHTGLAGRRRHVSVELRAQNRTSLLRPDAARHFAARSQIVASGATLNSTLPSMRIIGALRARGICVRQSTDAGDYVCNQTLYLSLAAGMQAGFIHIPRLGQNTARRGGKHRPPINRLSAALGDALVQIAVSLRCLKGRHPDSANFNSVPVD